jgi:hypothetical protein
MKTFEHDGIVYQISSFSGANHNCVGVEIGNNSVRIINTNDPTQRGTFTHAEWEAFVSGVKKNEFDLKSN